MTDRIWKRTSVFLVRFSHYLSLIHISLIGIILTCSLFKSPTKKIKVAMKLYLISVSYTHLDVYKRQSGSFPTFPIKMTLFTDILLFLFNYQAPKLAKKLIHQTRYGKFMQIFHAYSLILRERSRILRENHFIKICVNHPVG